MLLDIATRKPISEPGTLGTVVHRDDSNLWTMWLADAFDRPSHLGVRRDRLGLMLIPPAGGLFVPNRHVPRLRQVLAEAYNSFPLQAR